MTAKSLISLTKCNYPAILSSIDHRAAPINHSQPRMQLTSKHSLIHLTGLLSALIYGYLCLQSYQQPGLVTVLTTLGINSLLVFGLWVYLWRTDTQPLLWQLLFWALLFRILGVMGMPLLEDDFFRYLWDGRMLMETGSPYGVPPNAFFDNDQIHPHFEEILDQINHPNIATIYGPVLQWLFGLSYLISPGKIWPLQLMFAAFDIGIILLLATIIKPRNLLLYAWCPLLIKEIAFTAHTDVVAVFLLLAACLMLQRKQMVAMTITLALSVAAKVFALILAPLLLLRYPRGVILFSLTLMLIYAPFANDILAGGHGLQAMASGWVFNAPLYYLLDQWEWRLKGLLGSLFLGFWCYCGYRWYFAYKPAQPNLPRADLIYGVFLLIVPAVNPWYLVWLLPFAAIRPNLTAWTASAAVLLAYVIGLNLESSGVNGYQQPVWALALEYGLIGLALAADFWRSQRFSTNNAPGLLVP